MKRKKSDAKISAKEQTKRALALSMAVATAASTQAPTVAAITQQEGEVTTAVLSSTNTFVLTETPAQVLTATAAVTPTPEVWVEVNGNWMVLTNNAHYTLSYTDNNIPTKAATITVTGKGSYDGISTTQNFEIWGGMDVAKISLTQEQGAKSNEYTFTGSTIKPTVESIVLGGNDLIGTASAYTVTYHTSNSAAVGEYWMCVSGKDAGYTYGEQWFSYNIVAADISSATITVADTTFTGAAQTPKPTVTLDGKNLTENTDYYLTYSGNVDVGDATVTVTGMGNYSGSASKTFAIAADSTTNFFDGAAFTAIDAQIYTGTAFTTDTIKPEVWIEVGGEWIKLAEEDYKAEISNESNAATDAAGTPGKHKYVVTGTGKYSTACEATTTFEVWADITAMDLTMKADVSSAASSSFSWTGSDVKPYMELTKGTFVMSSNDYSSEYVGSTTDTGTVWVGIKPSANSYLYGELWKSYDITAQAATLVVATIANQKFTGDPVEAAVAVTVNDVALTEGTHYTVAYTNNEEIGTATATITGIGGYAGSNATANFIIEADGTKDQFAGGSIVAIDDQNYIGTAFDTTTINPEVWVVTENGNWLQLDSDDYNATITHSESTSDKPIAAGTPGVNIYSIEGKGNYASSSTLETTFEVWADLADATATFAIGEADAATSFGWTGSAVEPTMSLSWDNFTLDSSAYEVEYVGDSGNTSDAGIVWAGAKPTYGAYVYGEGWEKYTIAAQASATLTVEAIAAQTFTGDPLEPTVVVKVGEVALTEGTHYTVTYTNNVDVSTDTATAKITGMGGYAGASVDAKFEIKADTNNLFTDDTSILGIDNQTYSGTAIAADTFTSEVWVVTENGNWLELGSEDYNATIVHSASTESAPVAAGTPGTNIYRITGKGNYAGSSFDIKFDVWADLATATPTFTIPTGSDSASISDTETATTPSFGWTGSDVKPTMALSWGDYTLDTSAFEVEYVADSGNTSDVGTVWVGAKPTAEAYAFGECWGKYEISAQATATLNVEAITAQTFTGDPLEPTVVVKVGDVTLTKGTHYTVAYTNNVDVSTDTATATITGVGGYAGASVEAKFEISVSTANLFTVDTSIADIDNQTYSGKAIAADTFTPDVWVVTENGNWLQLDSADYEATIVHFDNTELAPVAAGTPGTNIYRITGKGNYAGSNFDKKFEVWADLATATATFEIPTVAEPASISDTETDTTTTFDWTGSDVKPTMTISWEDYTLDTSAYEVEYVADSGNTSDVGTVWVGAKPTEGAYAFGECWDKYEISASKIDADSLTIGTVDSQVFTGAEIKPTPSVTVTGGTELKAGTHFEYSYEDNVVVSGDDSSAKIIIKGIGAFEGLTTSTTFKITEATTNLFTSAEIGAIADMTYSGTTLSMAAVAPEVWLEIDGVWTELVKDTHYTAKITHEDDTNDASYVGMPGIHTYTITGVDGYGTVSTKEIKFTVWGDLEKANVTFYDADKTAITSVPCTGSAITISYEVSFGEGENALVVDSGNYTTSVVGDNSAAGEVWVGFIAAAETCYFGEAWASYEVTNSDLEAENATTVTVAAATYTGSAVTPEPVVTYTAAGSSTPVTLVKDKDYTLTYDNNIDVAAADATAAPTVYVTGMGIYSGTVSQTFAIALAADVAFTVGDVETMIFTGSALTPEPTVTVTLGVDNTVTLVKDQDFTYSYDANTAIGTAAKVSVTGKGNYVALSTPKEATFTIAGDLSTATISMVDGDGNALTDTAQAYTGTALTPAIKVNIDGVATAVDTANYSVTYNDNTDLGWASITVAAVADVPYLYTQTIYFEIVGASIADATVVDIAAQGFTGDYVEPVLAVAMGATDLVLNQDYTVSYLNNVDVAKADAEVAPTAVITGIGNYSGTQEVNFEIEAGKITNLFDDISIVEIPDQTYTGAAVTPTVEAWLKSPATGEWFELVEGTDYTIGTVVEGVTTGDYSNNTAPGTGTVNIVGIGSYAGNSATEKFEIWGDVSAAYVTFTDSEKVNDVTTGNYLWTGEEIKPTIEIAFEVSDSDDIVLSSDNYTVSYTATADPGMVAVTITGKDTANYFGTISTFFTIVANNLSTATDLDITVVPQAYTGGAVTPSGDDVVVKLGAVTLEEGVDYTLSYNDNVGTGLTAHEDAIIYVMGMGGYSGFAEENFTIKVADADALVENASMTTIEAQIFKGDEITPIPEIWLEIAGVPTDISDKFDYSYTNCQEAGNTAKVIATGKAGTVYEGGIVDQTFEIWGDLSAAAMTIDTDDNGALVYSVIFTSTDGDDTETTVPSDSLVLLGGTIDAATGKLFVNVSGTGYYYGELWGELSIFAAPTETDSEDAAE